MNFFSTDGLRLTYQVDGPSDAPALVLVNSLGTDLHMWDQQVALLSKDLRIVRYDCRGHSASDVPAGPYSFRQLGEDLLSLLDTLRIERAHICGLSLGGMIALWFTARYPDRVLRAIFANTAARIGTETTWNERIELVRSGGMAAIRQAVLARFLSAPYRQQHPEVTQQIDGMLESTDPLGYIAACMAIRDTDLHPLLPLIHTPSLIIAGSLDESTPPSLAEELHAALPESELLLLPDVAHLSNVERPETFSERVLDFLLHQR